MQMSNEALVQAVLEFPFLCDLFAFSNVRKGVENFENICDAYAELVSRDDGKDVLMEVLETRAMLLSQDMEVTTEIENEALSILLVHQDKFKDKFTENDVQIIDNSSNMIRQL